VIFDETASDGVHIITAMLLVGLVFLSVIAIGELTHWLGHRRRARKSSLPRY
jgi:hypothetical protein